MPKIIVEDVVPPEKKSIRNIPIPANRNPIDRTEPIEKRNRNGRPPEAVTDRPTQPANDIPEEKPRQKRKKGKWKLFLVIIIIVIILGLTLSYAFANATVTVTPKQQTLPTNITISAHTDPGEADVLYQTIALTKEKSLEVTTTGEEDVEYRASGSIIIYNNFGTSPQVLIENTRFRTPNGLIYRIREQVSVPGKTANAPGSLKVTVYADEPGEKYNLGLQDFVIPGFESDPDRFKTITAKSDPSSPLQGGFVGKIRQVSERDATAAKATLEADLKKEIDSTISAQIPDGYMFIRNEQSVRFEDLPQKEGSTPGTALVTKKAVIDGIIINIEQLENEIVTMTAGEESSSDLIRVGNIESLPITVEKSPTASDPSLRLGIQGNVQLVWRIDSSALSNSLAGKSRRDLKAVLSQYPSVERAEAVSRPFWTTSFPGNPEKINIEVIQP